MLLAAEIESRPIALAREGCGAPRSCASNLA
jgi:hypothetical protein